MLLASTDLYWYDDNGGTRMPRADTYTVEHSQNGTDWTPVTLTDGSTYAGALQRNAYNHLEFEPVEASYLRVRITGVQTGGAGTGILRWRVNGDTVDSVASPVIVRTVTGEVPTLPASLDVVYSSGRRGAVDFTWQPITPAMVAETNVEPFTVYGTNTTYGLIAEAQVYVRPESSQGGISIQGAEQFEQSVDVGEQPWLPTKVLVSYNDGSRDNQAIGVEWDYDESVVQTPGVYVIQGDLVLPDYVSTAGTTTTTLTLTVGDGVPAGPAVTVTAETRCLAGKVYVAVRALNDDDVPLTVRLDTPFGTKTFNGVEPGKNAYQSFASRTTSVEAGAATVVATDAEGRSTTVTAQYDAATCG
ncbi:Ig-like domain-containing protein [Cellulosimicrobium cellulans]|uniref:Ig-like domain-containing protein n=1 Tax=Cellulosimicrobium cellulans TaxID=1710 RepID=UPI001FCB92EA|nr:Ig-like domain-containing protein [Cellulosimicrobium cellulans]